ncbi:MAG: class I SAM-dependent methyltransferase [Anaerolineae bacterium]|nr:class I SAM-dependent methyltransferase [Anaerolineae bacterium]
MARSIRARLGDVWFSSRYHARTLLHRYYPGGYGYMRTLRHVQDSGYTPADVNPLYYAHGGWEDAGAGIQQRGYQSYEEYVVHQKEKFNQILYYRGGFQNATIALYRRQFYGRFRHLWPYLPRNARILCAGARQGTEVEVLRDLGYRQAYGIDLNPGPDNPYVQPGDFMHTGLPDASLDMVYTNCVDHAFDLDQFFREHRRIVKPGGYVLYDIVLGKGGGFEAARWDNEWALLEKLKGFFPQLIRAQRDDPWLWVLLRRSPEQAANDASAAQS